MKAEVRVRAPYSVVLIGSDQGRVPDDLDGILGVSDDCIAVGTVGEDDGDVVIELTDEWTTDASLAPLFDGVLLLGMHRVDVTDVLGETYLSLPITSDRARLRVFVDHPKWPSQIRALVSPAPSDDHATELAPATAL